MATAVHLILAATLMVAAILAFAADRQIRRSLRRPRWFQATCFVAGALLVPAQLYFALDDRTGGVHRTLQRTTILLGLVVVGGLLALVLVQRIAHSPTRLPRRVLAIGAHPDDLELACGATLAKLADSGHEIFALVMSRGGVGGDAALRGLEAEDAALLMGATATRVLDFPDTRLGEHEADLVRAVEDVVHRFNPDIIFTHSRHDQHQDHLAVHQATMRAARRHAAVLCFESPSATSDFEPSVFVDVEDYVETKVAAVDSHRDQRGKPYMTPERVRGLAVVRGAEARVRHAEGFEPVRRLGTAMGDL